METNGQNNCAKKKLTPWVFGLVALILVTLALLFFGVKKERKMRAIGLSQRKAKSTATVQKSKVSQAPTSYHDVIDRVRPSVVGISIPGAKPFLQVWYPSAMQTQEVPQAEVQAPNAQQKEEEFVRKEYLECPNCRVRINPTPGIPWSGASCPNCKTTMARVIRESPRQGNVPNRGSQGTPVHNPWIAQNPLGLNFHENPFNVITHPPQEQAQAQNKSQVNGTPVLNPWRAQNPIGLNFDDNPFNVQPPRGQKQAQTQTGPQVSGQNQAGIGAGVIISKKGYILTSYHLVAGQPEVTVTIFTPQGSKTFPGNVEATMAESDLAVVRIITNGTVPLPAASLGDSDTVSVGETVLAFGNPFGLSQTVTSGIVSAKRQSIVVDGQTLHNLIQTDAPINQGNSGGPIVNMRGEIIGINTAIYSPMQTHTGLGFAVPINVAMVSLSQFIDPQKPKGNPAGMQWLSVPKAYPTGRQAKPNEDSPAWMGVEFQILNDVLAEQLGTPFDSGLLINQVFPNSPAAAAGLKRGDVIYRANGRRINDETQVRTFLADKKPGDTVKFSIFRKGKKMKFEVTLAGGSWQQAAANIPLPQSGLLQGSEIEAGTADIVSLGLTVDKITPEVAFAFGLPENSQGVVISAVEGLSMDNGVLEGDVIRSVNGTSTPDLLSFFKALKSSNLAEGVDLGLERRGKELHVFVKDNPAPQTRGV